MLDKLSCILCLEKACPTGNQISIDSVEPQSLNAREIIERYFKEELVMKSYFSSKIVCNQCWEHLQSFHEFYVRVKNAHLAASNTLKSLQELEIAVTEIKSEPEAIDELATTPQKRRRGRPRRQNVIVNENEKEEFVDLKKCTVRIEQLSVPYEVGEKREDVKDDENSMGEEFLDVKTEDMLEETMDTSYSPQFDDNDDDSNSSSSEHEHTIKSDDTQKQQCLPKKKRKYTKRRLKGTRKERNSEREEREEKKRHKTADYDEYIAQNFTLICCLCQKNLQDFRELKTHFRQQHKMNGYVKCCGKKLIKRGVLVDHIHFHNDPEYFKCQQCDKLMADRRSLETHIQIAHGCRERVYHCDVCKKGFFRREVLARHYTIHAPEEQRKIKCTQCEKTFCNKYSMNQHLKLVHLHLYSKICDICGKSFHGGEAFRRHQQEHSGVPRSLIKCELCDAELTTKYGLARHMKVMHTEEYQTPQVCPICSKVSPTLRAHLSHVKYVHTTQKKHACKLCDKAFKRPNDLREHITTHTGEVLYTCTFCPQTFNSNANMYAHRKRKHPKEWAEKFGKKHTSTRMSQQIQNDLASIIESANAVEVKPVNVVEAN